MRTLSRFFLTICFFACIVSSGLAQGNLTADQKNLLKAALDVSVGKQKLLHDYNSLKSTKKIALYNKMTALENPKAPPVYLTEADVPKIKKVKFILQNEAQLMDSTRNEDFLFLRVAQINQPVGDVGIVAVLGQWAIGKESRARGYVFKQAMAKNMLFRKVNGTWKFEKVLYEFPNLLDYKEDEF